MSWERMFERKERAVCVCGKGYVIHTTYTEGDDWNRYREGTYGARIECDECAQKYHIESITKSYLTSEGYETVTTDYLVPNGMTLEIKIEPTRLPYERFLNFSENAVALFSKGELQEAIENMRKSKYSTRVSLGSSRTLVELHLKCKRSKSLPKIISALESCIVDYDSYEWTHDKVVEYKEREKLEIEENQKKLQQVLAQSHKLRYEYE